MQILGKVIYYGGEENLMSKVIQTKPEPVCPSCGAKMVLRRPKPGGKQFEPFWGCNRYPDCRGTRSIDLDGKPVEDEEEW